MTAGKSVFNAAETVAGLVEGAEAVAATRQAGGNFQRVVTAGRNIGVDRVTGAQTSTYTVITNVKNQLGTMFQEHPEEVERGLQRDSRRRRRHVAGTGG